MEVRLRPMDGNGQHCRDFQLELSHGIETRSYIDGFGNHVHYFNLVRPHSGVSVVSRSVVETGLGPDADPREELVQDFLRFRSPVKDVDGVRDLARVRLRPLGDERVQRGRRRARPASRRVPGLRPPAHRVRPGDGRAGALRERVHPLTRGEGDDRRTPGPRRGSRARAGSASTPRTPCAPRSTTCGSRSAATTPTRPRRAACTWGPRPGRCRSA